MEKQGKISFFQRAFWLILVMVTLVCEVGNQQLFGNFYFEEPDVQHVENGLADTENPSPEKVYVIGYEAVIPFVQLNISCEAYLENTFFPLKVYVVDIDFQEAPSCKICFFRRFLKKLISPNAP